MQKNRLTLEETIILLDEHINHVKWLKSFFQNKSEKFRVPNFPEYISENIIMHIIESKEHISCTRCVKVGDLLKGDQRIECKTFSSKGPSSFGPKEKWSQLYILDGTDYIKKNFILYRINLSNDDEKFKNVKINKCDTFEKQCCEKRRPRLHFNSLHQQLKDYIDIIFTGNIETL